ncbi:MAG: methyl-accepting chemotaxis protein [Alkaliphilus sp.]
MFKRNKTKNMKFSIKGDKKDNREKKQKKEKKIKFGIGFKIGRGFAILILLTLVGMAVFYVQLHIISEGKMQVEKTTSLEEKAHAVAILQKDYIITSDLSYVAQIRSLMAVMEKEIENYSVIAPEKKEDLDNTIKYLDEYMSAISEYSSMQESMEMTTDMSTKREGDIVSGIVDFIAVLKNDIRKFEEEDNEEMVALRVEQLGMVYELRRKVPEKAVLKRDFFLNLTNNEDQMKYANLVLNKYKIILREINEFTATFTENEYIKGLNSLKELAIRNESGFKNIIEKELAKDEFRAVYDERSKQLISIFEAMNQEVINELQNAIDAARMGLIFVVIGTAMVAIVVSTLIARNIVKPIKSTVNMLKDMAEGEGDLTSRLEVKSKDEMGEMAGWFNLFIEKIHDVVAQVKTNANNLAEAVDTVNIAINESNEAIEEISDKTEQMSDGFQNNASAVEETTASIEEMASSSTVMAEDSDSAFNEGRKIKDYISVGDRSVNEVVEANSKVKESTEKLSTTIFKLKESSEQVNEIISIITGITEQTNLLSLNAAIEAARAGEHGRGFAVVADEVRKLAEQSKSSATKISELIGDIQKGTEKANEAVNKEQKLVDIAVEKTAETDKQFQNIKESVEQMTTKIGDMASASKQQSMIADEMSKAMDEISGSTMESANSSAEISETLGAQAESFDTISINVENMKKSAMELKELTDKFKV